MTDRLAQQWMVEALVNDCGEVVRLLGFEGVVEYDDPELTLTITPVRRRAPQPERRQWGDR